VSVRKSSDVAGARCAISLNTYTMAKDARYPMQIAVIDERDFLLKPWTGGIERMVIMNANSTVARSGDMPRAMSLSSRK